MNTFEYLAVLFSIIIGLALTELLQCVRGLIVARARVILFWPSLLRAAFLFLVMTQVWWSAFGLRNLTDWTFGSYAIVLLQIVLLYLVTALALPDPGDGETVDLEAAYFANARPSYGLMIAATLISILKDLVLSGRLPDPINLAFHGVFGACALAACLSRNRTVHVVLTAFIFASYVAYVVTLFARLPD